MASEWTPPKGFTLTIIPAHTIDDRGMNRDGADPRRPSRPLMLDGSQEVFWFDEAEPYTWTVNDGTGQFASQEAKDAAAAGKPMAGWSPHGEHKPIKGGYVPDQYVLTHDADPTPITEPASVATRELSPREEAARLKASVKATQERIRELEGGAS